MIEWCADGWRMALAVGLYLVIVLGGAWVWATYLDPPEPL